jgi:hypothetical protein
MVRQEHTVAKTYDSWEAREKKRWVLPIRFKGIFTMT